MERVRVISKKYDGSLRDEYEPFLVADTADSIVVLSPPGRVSFDHRKQAHLQAPDGLLEIYPKDKWFNVWHIVEQNTGLNLMYVNIARPASLHDGVLEWVDLDLDYRVHLDWRIEKLDEAEYAQNALRMGYSPEVQDRVRAACTQVELGLERRAYPFNHDQQVQTYRKLMECLTTSEKTSEANTSESRE
jgi:protein associated with RNAse G/E